MGDVGRRRRRPTLLLEGASRADGVRTGRAQPPTTSTTGRRACQHVTVSLAGEVVDCGGYVVPDDYERSDRPMPMPDLAERELTVTIGLPAPAPAPRPLPASGAAPPQGGTETTTRSGRLQRLRGRG